jgi:hypothetical protein
MFRMRRHLQHHHRSRSPSTSTTPSSHRHHSSYRRPHRTYSRRHHPAPVPQEDWPYRNSYHSSTPAPSLGPEPDIHLGEEEQPATTLPIIIQTTSLPSLSAPQPTSSSMIARPHLQVLPVPAAEEDAWDAASSSEFPLPEDQKILGKMPIKSILKSPPGDPRDDVPRRWPSTWYR